MGLTRKLEILYQRMKEAGASVLEFELGSQEKLRLALKKAQGPGAQAPAPAAGSGAPAPSSPTGHPVPAPLSGIFFRAPSPSSPAFVEEGSMVHAGDVLCIIEAMKVMNEIKAPRAGRVQKILGANGKHVKKGDIVFYIGEGN